MKRFFLLTFSLLSIPLFSSENLLQNPGFENDFNAWPVHNSWGNAAGSVRIISDGSAHAGKKFVRLEKCGSNGASQLISPMTPFAFPELDFSYFWRGRAPHIHVLFFREVNGKKEPVLDEFKKHLIYASYPNSLSKEWKKFSSKIRIPKKYLKDKLFFQIKFMAYGILPLPSVYDLDDIVMSEGVSRIRKKIRPPQKITIKDVEMSDLGIPPMPKLDYTPGMKDGYLTKNGNPFYYVGSTTGGGQWDLASLWMLRLQNYSFTMLDWSNNAMRLNKKNDNELEISWCDASSAASAVRELTRQNIIIEYDGGNYMPAYSQLQYQADAFPGIRKFFVEGNHFYSLDHNTPEGRRLHFNDWRAKFRFFRRMPFLAFECWNELGYRPSHERVLKGYREYAKKKYSTLAEACRVWGKDFSSWEEVYPPHLTPDVMDGARAHQHRLEMRRKYYQMYYDYLRYVQEDFAAGLKEMKKEFRKYSDAPFSVDWRGHQIYNDGYCAQDISLIKDEIDLHLLHNWTTLYSYNNQTADEESVLTSICTSALYHNFLRTNSTKPILNPEDIKSRVSLPGSNLAYMKQNCLAKFPAKWKFTLENDRSGIEKGYFKPEFDDSSWGKMDVPGCWDETPEYKGRKGFGWYRTSFTVPGRLAADYRDGSRKFYLFGKGVAQNGTIWINGHKIGSVTGWSTDYQFDIGSVLRYGGKNQITFLVNGSNYSNGLRFYVYVLPGDRINKTRSYEERDYAAILWTFMMQGNSGVDLWHWDSMWRPFMAKLAREVNSVADLAMPAARQEGNVRAGILMPYLFFRGLPVPIEKTYHDYMNYYGSLFFANIPVSVPDEEHLADLSPETTPVLFCPGARIVWQKTFDALKKYVEKGGTLVVNFDSMRMNFERYRKLDIDSFAGIRIRGPYQGRPEFTIDGRTYPLYKGDMTKSSGVSVTPEKGTGVLAEYADGTPAVTSVKRGKGKVVFIAANPKFAGTNAIVSGFISKIPEKIVFRDTGSKEEFPFLEGKIAGTPERFLLYVFNWGGRDRNIVCSIPETQLGKAKKFRIRNVRDPEAKALILTAEALKKDGFKLKSSSMTPAVWLFEDADLPARKLAGISEERKAMLEKIDKLNRTADYRTCKGKKALFIAKEGEYDVGNIIYPQITAVLRSLGIEICSVKSSDITPEMLSGFSFVFLGESSACGMPKLMSRRKELFPMFVDYVKNGGALFVTAFSAQGANVNSRQRINTELGPYFGFSRGYRYARNDRFCGYDDPMQIRTDNFAAHPAAAHLKEVQFFTLPPFVLHKKCKLVPIVKTAKTDRVPDAPIVIGGELGKGRAIFLCESMWHQPFRVDACNNLQLLHNLLSWVTKNPVKKLTAADRKALLVLPEEQMIRAEKEEQAL